MVNKILAGFGVVVLFVALAYAASTTFTNVRVKGSLQVAGVSTMDSVSAGQVTLTGGLILPVVDVAVSTPSAAGLLVRTAASVVYISTGTANPTQWSKVGAQ